MSAPACPRCAHSVGPFGVQDAGCMFCRDKNRQINASVRAGRYTGTTATLLRAFKYHGRDELDDVFGRILFDALQLADWTGTVDALVIVPTHWRHSLRRAYYAPALLARNLSRRTKIPIAPILRRVTGGPHQFNVPHSERAANIRGKFSTIPGVHIDGATLCLIDDVSTTGATLDECARVLRRTGAAAVFAAVATRVDADRITDDV
ncbi:MAG: ComF family protein [Phycisphaerales bacterium]|nr:ComF family protein [Phycisphaerales bacterium]